MTSSSKLALMFDSDERFRDCVYEDKHRRYFYLLPSPHSNCHVTGSSQMAHPLLVLMIPFVLLLSYYRIMAIQVFHSYFIGNGLERWLSGRIWKQRRYCIVLQQRFDNSYTRQDAAFLGGEHRLAGIRKGRDVSHGHDPQGQRKRRHLRFQLRGGIFGRVLL